MRLTVTAELDNGFRQVVQFEREMRSGDSVLVDVIDAEHIAMTSIEPSAPAQQPAAAAEQER